MLLACLQACRSLIGIVLEYFLLTGAGTHGNRSYSTWNRHFTKRPGSHGLTSASYHETRAYFCQTSAPRYCNKMQGAADLQSKLRTLFQKGQAWPPALWPSGFK
jgi:hypothetical protein